MCREGNPGATASKCGPTNSVEGSIDGYAPKHHPVTEPDCEANAEPARPKMAKAWKWSYPAPPAPAKT